MTNLLWAIWWEREIRKRVPTIGLISLFRLPPSGAALPNPGKRKVVSKQVVLPLVPQKWNQYNNFRGFFKAWLCVFFSILVRDGREKSQSQSGASAGKDAVWRPSIGQRYHRTEEGKRGEIDSGSTERGARKDHHLLLIIDAWQHRSDASQEGALICGQPNIDFPCPKFSEYNKIFWKRSISWLTTPSVNLDWSTSKDCCRVFDHQRSNPISWRSILLEGADFITSKTTQGKLWAAFFPPWFPFFHFHRPTWWNQ